MAASPVRRRHDRAHERYFINASAEHPHGAKKISAGRPIFAADGLDSPADFRDMLPPLETVRCVGLDAWLSFVITPGEAPTTA